MALPPSAPRAAALLVVALATAGALAPAPAEERALERTARADAAVALDGTLVLCADLSLDALARIALGARLGCAASDDGGNDGPGGVSPEDEPSEDPREGRGLVDGTRSRPEPRRDAPRGGPADTEGTEGPEHPEPDGAREGAGGPAASEDGGCASSCAQLDASARGVGVLPQPRGTPGLLARAMEAVVGYLG